MPHTLQKLVFYVGLYKQYEGAHNIVIEPYQIIIGTWGLTTLKVTCITSCHKHQELLLLYCFQTLDISQVKKLHVSILINFKENILTNYLSWGLENQTSSFRWSRCHCWIVTSNLYLYNSSQNVFVCGICPLMKLIINEHKINQFIQSPVHKSSCERLGS